MPNTATRLITLLMLLQRRPNQKAAELAEALGISVRSLHRYIAMLDDLGIPVYSERGPYGGFSLVRGYKMPPLIFSSDEAVALYLGTSLVRDMWGELYRQAAQGALAKLDNVLPDDQRSEVAWAQRTLVTADLHRTTLSPFMAVLENLRGASRAQRRVHLEYRVQEYKPPLARDVDIYALAYRRGWWYAIGYCHLRQAVRTFRVDHIRSVAVLDATVAIPEDFDPQRYLAFEMPADAPIRVKLLFSPETAFLATNFYSPWDEMTTLPDGSVQVAISLADLNVAAGMTLSYGTAVTILEPEALRQLVGEWASALAARYRPASG